MGMWVPKPLAQEPGGQLCRFGIRSARTHAEHGASRTRLRGAALPARHQIGNKTLAGLLVSCSGSGTRTPATNGLGGCQKSRPPTPAPLPGPGARGPLTAEPGLPVQPRVSDASSARSPWGERETVDRRRALTRRLFCGEQQAARPSGGGQGGGEGESAQLSSLAPWGTRNADWRAAGGGRVPGGVGSGGAPSAGINYCLGARVPARAASEAQCPPSRLLDPRKKI